VHAARQIQAQLHGFGTQGRQPFRRGRCQVQGNYIVEPERLLDDPLGGQLLFALTQPQQTAVATQFSAEVGDARGFQGFPRPGQYRQIQLGGAALRSDLNRRVGRVQVG